MYNCDYAGNSDKYRNLTSGSGTTPDVDVIIVGRARCTSVGI
jgi:hypothetical protein